MTNETQPVILKHVGTRGEKMPKPTVIDAEYEETEVTEITIESRVANLEELVKGLLESHKNILEHFREMIIAVTEISEEPPEE